MSFATIYDVVHTDNHVLKKQVAVAILQCAVDILNEDEQTENHWNRFAWAKMVTQDSNGPDLEMERWFWLIMTNATFQSDPSNQDDGAVKTVVTGHVNTMANARR
ncbi:MAG: hypothetical protein GF411_06380 [Candidatus Lokiarchaeota archaeon]|nr:hypothetical protein [Candidatus Lokiarchaeota archaeon]